MITNDLNWATKPSISRQTGKPVEHLDNAVKAVAVKDDFLRYCTIGKQLAYAGYLTLDGIIFVRMHPFRLSLPGFCIVCRCAAESSNLTTAPFGDPNICSNRLMDPVPTSSRTSRSTASSPADSGWPASSLASSAVCTKPARSRSAARRLPAAFPTVPRPRSPLLVPSSRASPSMFRFSIVSLLFQGRI